MFSSDERKEPGGYFEFYPQVSDNAYRQRKQVLGR